MHEWPLLSHSNIILGKALSRWNRNEPQWPNILCNKEKHGRLTTQKEHHDFNLDSFPSDCVKGKCIGGGVKRIMKQFVIMYSIFSGSVGLDLFVFRIEKIEINLL